MTKPIEVPPELFYDWWEEGLKQHPNYAGLAAGFVARKAAEWAADQELEACCEWLRIRDILEPAIDALALRAARRPKPPSLKEQALEALSREEEQWPIKNGCRAKDFDAIRRALESIPD